jgi:phosphotriesterase-related protein
MWFALAIQTVLGPIDRQELGFCHAHEHLFLADGQPAKVNPALRIDDFDATLRELRTFRHAGGKAIVDAQPLGCGRMEAWLAEASALTGSHIVASTGFHKLAFYPPGHWIYQYGQQALRDVFIHELTVGMFAETDTREPAATVASKAGIIKTAIDEERIRDPEKKWFYAAASAAMATGAPLLCHTESWEQAVWLVDFYRSQGVPPRQIIVCHMDRKIERLDIHLQLATQGVYLEYDTIGRFKYHSDEEEAQLIRFMVEHGFEDSILLGLDTTRQRMRSYGGEIGLDYLACRFLPLLRESGIDSAVISKMMTANPSEAFDNKRMSETKEGSGVT